MVVVVFLNKRSEGEEKINAKVANLSKFQFDKLEINY